MIDKLITTDWYLKKPGDKKVLTELVIALEGIDGIHDSVRHQLDVTHKLADPEAFTREDVTAALQACRVSQHGIFHHLRFQIFSHTLKREAAALVGSSINGSLAVNKIRKLVVDVQEARADVEPEWGSVHFQTWVDIFQRKSELDATTHGNSVFLEQHATELGQIHEKLETVQQLYARMLSSTMTSIVIAHSELEDMSSKTVEEAAQRLDSIHVDSGQVLAQLTKDGRSFSATCQDHCVKLCTVQLSLRSITASSCYSQRSSGWCLLCSFLNVQLSLHSITASLCFP